MFRANTLRLLLYTGVSGEITFNEIGDANRDSAYIKTANTADNVWEFVTVQTVE